MLLLSRTRYELPLQGAEARKFDSLSKVVDWTLIGRTSGRSRFTEREALIGAARARKFDGPLFLLRLPLTTARLLRQRRPEVVVAQDPYLGAAAMLARRLVNAHVPIAVEVHGDWRTATRLYGSEARRLLAWPADALATSTLRRADTIRASSDYTAALVRRVGRTAEATFHAYLDLGPFLATPPKPLPATPTALFIGVLERYKNVDGLLTAWEHVAEQMPHARLRIVGKGALTKLVEETATRVTTIEYIPVLARDEIVNALDESTCLVLPSRSEGMGRVIVEAFARQRPVIAANVGGIGELVRNRDNGLLVDAEDPKSLSTALLTLLSDRSLAMQLASNAHNGLDARQFEPARFAESFASFVRSALSEPTPAVV